MKGRFSSALAVFRRYKYLIVVGLCSLYVGFLNDSSLVRRLGYRYEIGVLKDEIEKYRAEYEDYTQKLNDLTANPEDIEKIAREKYLMKKPNEDIYVFEDDLP
ncbi:MAG: septum formation initiator family protein [Bacteroides sp.]|nr:septum formation initiator family protein [Bacteroides sp.]